MDIRNISKALVGAAAAAATGVGSTTIVIPEGVDAPWWGYVLAGVLSAVFGGLAVYWAPANTAANRLKGTVEVDASTTPYNTGEGRQGVDANKSK